MTAWLSPALTWWSLYWPRQVEPDDLLAGLRQIAGTRRTPLVLRAEASEGQVRHLVGAANQGTTQLLARQVPGLRYAEVPLLALEGEASALSVRFSTRRRSVIVDDATRTSAGLLSAMASVRGSDRLVLEWVLLAGLSPEAVPNRLDGLGPESWSSALLKAPLGAPDRADPENRRALAAKRSEPGWRGLGRVAVQAATEQRRRALLGGVVSALRAVESPGLRLVVRRTRVTAMGTASLLAGRPAALSAAELPVLAGWPHGDLRELRDSPIRYQASRVLDATASMPPVSGEATQRLVAVGQRGNRERALVLPVRDGLRHAHILGPTGVGKSTLMLGLIEADMATGRSLVVFDPKGDLVADVLARVPKGRRDDVVVFDPSDETPVGLNPLIGSGPAELVADGLLGTLHELFAAHWGPRTQDILHACLLSLARQPKPSLALVPLLLTHPGYRARVTAGIRDPLGLGGFWQWYEGLSEAERLAAIGPVANKLRQLLLRPALRAVIAQTDPRFNLGEIFSGRRIVLVNLSSGSLGPEGAALFGALMWSRLWQLSQGRSRVPATRRHPVTIYADEFQEYLKAPVSFTDMLVQARGLGVGLVLAHQHLGQLTPTVREAVLGNAGSRVVFQLLAGDAKVISGLGHDLEPDDITELRAFDVYANLRSRGEATGWMSGRTLPASPRLTDPKRVQAQSRHRYGRDRAETEAALLATIDERPVDGPGSGDLGVRRRRGGSK